LILYSKDVNKNLIRSIKLASEYILFSTRTKDNKTFVKLSSSEYNSILSYYYNQDNIIRIPILQGSNILSNFEDDNNSDLQLWHNILGHFYNKVIFTYLSDHNTLVNNCPECSISKLKRSLHNKIPPWASENLEVIHSDIVEPFETSVTGKNYLISFINEHCRKFWTFLLKEKSEATNVIIYFFKYHFIHFNNYNVKYFKSDNAKEYKNKKVLKFCKQNGIIKSFSPPHNPQNNGIVERFNQIIINCIKTILFKANLYIKFWDFALFYVNILYNITPHTSIQNNIPNELFYYKRINLSKIKVFSCIAYHNILQDKVSKLNENSDKGVFLGIDTFSNSYIIINYLTYKIVSTREETFFEDKFTNLLEFSRGSDNTFFVNFSFNLNSPSEHKSMFGDSFPVSELRE